MKKMNPALFYALTTCLTLSQLHGAENSKDTSGVKPPMLVQEANRFQTPATPARFEPFTGKVIKNRVRIRTQPSFDGPVLKELVKNDLVIVTAETDDFYTIKPPADVKAYIYRTFVLDNVIEGNRVNVRLKPDLDAPVVAQLNSGERVEGAIAAANNKWYEIKLPESTHFYIAKEYLEKVGDAGFLARMEKRKEEVLRLFSNAETISLTEMEKEFDKINFNGIKASYQHVINNFADFPEIVEKAKDALKRMQESYTAKKITHLETVAKHSSTELELQNKKLSEALEEQKNKITTLEQKMQQDKETPQPSPILFTSTKPTQLPLNMSIWVPAEEAYFAEWSKEHPNQDMVAYYESQKKDGFVLRGVIDAYNRPVKNKPGDYMLVNSSSKLPVAFLYSTQINLQDYIGHDVSIIVTQRPNNHYAFPAYFVLSIE